MTISEARHPRVVASPHTPSSVQSPAAAALRRQAWRDIALVIGMSVLCFLLSAHFQLDETLYAATRQLELLQLDELPAAMGVLLLGLIWLSRKHYRNARRELDARRTAEASLAGALKENRELAQEGLRILESERKHLARELHDELGQYLNAIKLDAVSVRDAAGKVPLVQDITRTMIGNIDRVYGVVTGLIRQLRPVGFDELGVTAALEHCVGDWRARLPSASIEMSITGDFTILDETRGLTLFRLVQEALTNVARHARATAVQISIAAGRIADGKRFIDIRIADNGCGVDMRLPRAGLGLVGMRERVAASGGSIVLASEPGAGFAIQAVLPLA